MKKTKPHKLSTLLAVYFVVLCIVFGGILLIWTYYTSVNSINTEIEKSFIQRKDFVVELLWREAERIDSALYEIKINDDLIKELTESSAESAGPIFLYYADKIARHKLDVLFISTIDDPLWVNASSPFPNVQPILGAIADSGREYLSEARIDHFKNPAADFTGIFRSRKIVREDGEVFGIVIGGTILNDNFNLVHEVMTKSKTPTVAFTEGRNMIASSSTPGFRRLEEILAHALQVVEHDPASFHRIDKYNVIFVYDEIDFPGSSDAAVMLGLTNDVFTDLNSSYSMTLIILFVLLVVFIISSFIFTRFMVYPSINRVLEYIRKISRDENDIAQTGGMITEVNTIGSAMEKMVESINLSKAELEESESKFRSYIENAPLGIFVADSEGNYLEVNRASEQITGFSDEELLRKNITDLVSEEYRENASAHFQRLLADGRSSGDLQYVRKDGSLGYWTVDAIKLTKDTYLGFVTDISVRKKSEETLRSSLREKEVLLQEVHHRVKNNLQLIISLLNIQKQYYSGDISVYNDTISRIRRFSVIYSRLYIQEDIANINFTDTIKESVDEIVSMYSAGNDSINVIYDIKQPILPIEKAIPLSLIINELITNSIKYAFENEGEITLTVYSTEDGEISRFIYTDNGRGMKSSKPGFGTELVEILAAQLNLDFNILSDDGVHYEFFSSRKRHIAAAETPDILYVEDEYIIALSRITGLEEMGYSVNNDVISSGEEVLQYLRGAETLPSLILMDVGLAGRIDGIDAAVEIRKKWDIPILFSSGFEDPGKLAAMKAVSNSGYIGKTCTDDELKVALDKLLNR